MNINKKDKFAFIGVTTKSSSVVNIFHAWCDILEVNWELVHWDLPVDCHSNEYSRIASSFRSEEIIGGLVTTHKANLFINEWRNFDLLEPLSLILNEIGVVFKRDGELCGGVSDVKSGGVILKTLTDSQIWRDGNRHVYILGAGGAGLAALWNLIYFGIGNAKHISVVEPNPNRREIARQLSSYVKNYKVEVLPGNDGIANEYIDNSEIGSLIINASGLGKDRFGSPISSNFIFPERAIVWEFNYRGDLKFLKQAKDQENERKLIILDGFEYFACGWSVVMSRVAGKVWTHDVFREFLKVASAKNR